MYSDALPVQVKTAVAFFVAFVLEPFIRLFMRWINLDWSMVSAVMGLVIVDTVFGLAIAYRKRDVSSKRFKQVFVKLFRYIGLLLMIGFLAKHAWLAYLDSPLYALIMANEAISILEKQTALGWRVPKWLVNRLRTFYETGKLSDTPPADPSKT
jgi:phage-related holin